MVIDHKSADLQLNKFIKNKLLNFGDFQDGANNKVFSGYHSVLSPLINVGLLDVNTIIKKVINNLNPKNHQLLASTEGYIRQLIGWREYCRLIYMFRHKDLEGNYFNNKVKLSNDWYKKKEVYTGFTFIDELINKTWDYAYLHHIERLMFVGNYMLLNRILPDDVYKWFQTMFLDGYAVFMYPNVYGMSQYSSGPVMMTKPYFSSAAYIMRMSKISGNDNMNIEELKDYAWKDVWNALYYSFINSNKIKLKKNYGVANQVSNWNRKNATEKRELLALSNKYKKSY